jgi:hypothetical protein
MGRGNVKLFGWYRRIVREAALVSGAMLTIGKIFLIVITNYCRDKLTLPYAKFSSITHYSFDYTNKAPLVPH